MRSRAALLLLPLLLAPAGEATAQTSAAPPTTAAAKATPTRIDPAIANVFGFRSRTGRTPLAYERNDRFEREGLLPVVIRFAAPPARVGLLPLASGAFAASIDESELARLQVDPNVVRVSCDLRRRVLRPLDQSAEETGIAGARRALRLKDGTALDGRGTRIADIDSGTFVYHPSLFHGDGGIHRWVDVNGDGQLTPGIDGVDLDGSGKVDDNEKLRILSVDSPVHGAGFDAGVDYVYVDTNGNGERDLGREFDEKTPAFGEPIFVVDDVDRDGKLALSERLLRLGTSKLAAVQANKTYTRGSGTSGINAYGLSLLRNPDTLSNADHGTAVAGILVGGVPERSQLLGLSPGAELLSISSREPAATSIQWAVDQKADVILTEYADYTGHPLDGSSEEELLLDAAAEKGIAVVNPAGNLGDAFKHRSVSLATGTNTFLLKTTYGFDGAPLVEFTVLHRGDPRALSLKVTMPDGIVINVPAGSTSGPLELEKNRMLLVTRRTSVGGTHEIHLELYAYATSGYGKLPPGRYVLAIDADAPVDAELFCKDSNTSWGYGLVFEQNTPTRTICHPATNNRGITVAAYVLHGAAGEIAGTLEKYSSVGPRLDGVAGIDLAAPANPFAPTTPPDPASMTVDYEQFGGTSGAGPHVASAIALLKQLEPTKSAAELQQKLLDTARRDSFVADEIRWGKGKLDVLRALDLPRTSSSPPRVTLTFPKPAPLGKPVEIAVASEGGTPPLRVKWDLDEDGKTEGEWEPLGTKTVSSSIPAFKDIKVDVLDGAGHLAGATARIVFAEPKQPDPPTTPAADPVPVSEEGGGCGCTTTARGDRGFLVAALLALALGRRRGHLRS